MIINQYVYCIKMKLIFINLSKKLQCAVLAELNI